VLYGHTAGPPADLWALGCVVFHLLTSFPPFQAENDYLTFEKIKKADLEFPEGLTSESVHLIRMLLKQEPLKRLGSGVPGSSKDFQALKSHSFFSGINFEEIYALDPPLDFTLSPQHSEDEELKLPQTLVSGVVKLWETWIYKRRLLFVTDEPNILYYNTKSEYLGSINFSSSLKTKIRSNKCFCLETRNKTYYFKAVDYDATHWVTVINGLLKV